MIIKKALATTSSFIISAVLLSQFYSYVQTTSNAQRINFSAFTNLTDNIISLSANQSEKAIASKETEVTNDIIKVIDHELSKKIRNTRLVVANAKAKQVEVKAKLVAKKTIIEEKKTILTNNEDYSAYEINNKELINLQAFTVEKAEYSIFEKLASTTLSNDLVKDEVVVAQASTEHKEVAPTGADEVKTAEPSTVKNEASEDEKSEDIVMFDYSAPKADAVTTQTIDQKLYERPLSNTVKMAISREMGNTPIKRPVTTQKVVQANTVKIDDQKIDLNSDDNVIFDYTNEKAASTQTKEEDALFAPPVVNTHETQFVIRAKEINLNTQKIRQSHGFEFVPDYDRAERVSDQTSGEIQVGYSLSGGMNTQTGVIQALGVIPTRVELNLGTMKGLEVPLINEAGIQKFLISRGLSIEGNLLMVALHSTIVDVEIDSQFGQRFFFNQNFKQTTNPTEASFVLFAGVKTGNVLLRYLLSNKESSQKIVYVGDGEMYFEDPSFSASTRETYAFTTRNLLGQKKKELTIDGGAISFFNTNIIAKKKALNAYEVKIPAMATGMRKYLEFKHLEDSLFVGSWSEKDIEIPGREFIGKVLEINQVSSLKDRCVVQVNLSKDLRQMTANGKNQSGEMFVETSYLDKEGTFSRDNAELAEKAFVVGDMEGQFNIKLDYTDGSTEFLKTFCSQGTYLIEQL